MFVLSPLQLTELVNQLVCEALLHFRSYWLCVSVKPKLNLLLIPCFLCLLLLSSLSLCKVPINGKSLYLRLGDHGFFLFGFYLGGHGVTPTPCCDVVIIFYYVSLTPPPDHFISNQSILSSSFSLIDCNFGPRPSPHPHCDWLGCFG